MNIFHISYIIHILGDVDFPARLLGFFSQVMQRQQAWSDLVMTDIANWNMAIYSGFPH